MLRGCGDKRHAPVSGEGAQHPGVRVALGSVGWLRTPCYLQLDFGANRVVQPWQAAPPGAWSWSRDGGKGLCRLFCSWLYLLSDAEWILLESLELLPCLSPLAPLKARLRLLPSTAGTPGTAWSPALPCCTLCAGEASHG